MTSQLPWRQVRQQEAIIVMLSTGQMTVTHTVHMTVLSEEDILTFTP